jgi:hypothetical protein
VRLGATREPVGRWAIGHQGPLHHGLRTTDLNPVYWGTGTQWLGQWRWRRCAAAGALLDPSGAPRTRTPVPVHGAARGGGMGPHGAEWDRMEPSKKGVYAYCRGPKRKTKPRAVPALLFAAFCVGVGWANNPLALPSKYPPLPGAGLYVSDPTCLIAGRDGAPGGLADCLLAYMNKPVVRTGPGHPPQETGVEEGRSQEAQGKKQPMAVT